MSKINYLKSRYPQINIGLFDFLQISDPSNNYKYMEYMTTMCSQLLYYPEFDAKLIIEFVDDVKNFHEQIQYIENKDIYHPYYRSWDNLKDANRIASKRLLEKELHDDAERNVLILYQTDSFIMIQPRVFESSKKYGSQTKWCTTNESSFMKYRDGGLVYVISRIKRDKNYDKIAFHTPQYKGFNSGYDIYNQIDINIPGYDLLQHKWTENELLHIDHEYRRFIKQFIEYQLPFNFNGDRLCHKDDSYSSFKDFQRQYIMDIDPAVDSQNSSLFIIDHQDML